MSAQRSTLVSVIMLTYNQEAFVAEAIESVLAQTYPDLEILVSDDASTDTTAERAARVVELYRGPHQLRLQRNARNLGLAAHFNAAVAATTGSIIVVADGDDVARPERIERTMAAFADPSTMLVCSNLTNLDAQGRRGGPFLARPPGVITRPLAEVTKALDCWVVGASMAFDRRLWEVFGPLGEDLDAEDHVIAFRAGLLGRLVYLDETLVDYRRHGGNLYNHGRGIDMSSRRSWLGHYQARTASQVAFVSNCQRDLATLAATGAELAEPFEALALDLVRRRQVLEARGEMFAGPNWARRVVLGARMLRRREVIADGEP